MRTVGLQELQGDALGLLTTKETLLIEHHGQPLGYFVPSKRRDPAADDPLLDLEQTLERVVSETGLSEALLAELFTLRRSGTQER